MGQVGHIKSEYGNYIYVHICTCANIHLYSATVAQNSGSVFRYGATIGKNSGTIAENGGSV